MATDGAAAPPDTAAQPADPPIQWDGDRMFNIYIHDYCVKRGFHKTARELVHEAAIPPQSHPPINAKQGLLFEWWSVFWVLFTAKSNGHGPEDALLYTQHQTASQNAAQKQQNRPGQPGQQQPQVRYANGLRPPNQPGPQSNGVGPPAPPQQQPSGPLPNGTNAHHYPGNMSQQSNGVPGSLSAPPGAAVPQQGQNMSQLPPNQRPPQQPQRGAGVNGVPFHSPTMVHSPPNPSGGMQPNNSIGGGMGPIGSNPPLTQVGRGGMLPPGGPQGPMGTAQHTPQPAFQSLVNPSQSNPGSPAQNHRMAPSPSMSHRQIPTMPSPEMIHAELNRIPPPLLTRFKQEMNLSDKDLAALTLEEKQQLVTKFHRSGMKTSMSGPSGGPQPGPSPMQPLSMSRNPPMPPGAQQQPGQPPLQQPPQGPGQQQRGAKRNSTSPGQEPEQLPRNDSSPPQNKRLRTGRSPSNSDGPPPMTPMNYPQHQQQQPPGMPPMQMQRVPMFPGQPMGNNTMLGHGISTPQMTPMNPPMNPGMMGVPAPGGMPNNPQIQQYRQAMQSIHKPPHLAQQMLPGGVGSPSSADVQGGPMQMQGGPSPANRMGMGQGKPMVGMMPPPSPAMAPKPPGGPQKPDDGSNVNGRIDASPQNAAAGIGRPPSGHPGTPVPTSTPAPHTPSATTMTAPSPSAILSGTPNMAPHPPPVPPPSTTDGLDPTAQFGFDLSAGLAEFVNDPMFNGESLNFERDFAAWFDPESAT